MKRLLLDQGVPRSVVAELARSGLDTLHVGDVGLSRATDKEILEFAASAGRVIVTLAADFHTILALTNAKKPSVIRVRIEGLNGEALSHVLASAWQRIRPAIAAGAAISITEKRIRIHRLPLVEGD